MKKLSIEEKAKAYDEAIRKAKDMLNYKEVRQEDMEYLFPELKESEDERIRKALIDFLKEEEAKADITSKRSKTLCKYIAWLEKQGEHANFRNKIKIGDKVTRNEDGVLVNLSQLNRVAKKDEKQGEKNLVKANEEWYDFIRWFVKERTDNYTLIPSDDDIHKWGDMILNHAQKIFEKQGEQKPYGQREECSDCEFRCGDKCIGSCAMKRGEQKPDEKTTWYDNMDDLIADAMIDDIKNADMPGHCKHNRLTWINKHRSKPAEWSEEDESMFENIKEILTKQGFHQIQANWLKSLKERVQPQPQQEWSEEDEYNAAFIIETLLGLDGDKEYSSKYKKMANWLKSLRPQNRWKPSDEQINALSITVKHGCTDDKEALGELLEQLKAL